jgi:glycosyltransferase involved in cell wall biosynthesis
VGYTINRGYDRAVGEYVVALGSDDYFYTDVFEQAMEELDGTDMVYFNLRTNNGEIWELTPNNKRELCGSTKFMKRSFLGDARCPDKRVAEDLDLYMELLKKNPTEKFTNLTVKHYNFPREGSLTNLNHKKKEKIN